MTIIVQMYRTCQYDSWEQASAQGGLYCTPVHSIDAYSEDGPVITDVVEAILNACEMMDGGYCVKLRVLEQDDAVDTYTTIGEWFNGERVISINAEISAFAKAFTSSYGYPLTVEQIAKFISAWEVCDVDRTVQSEPYYNATIDAWCLWRDARNYEATI